MAADILGGNEALAKHLGVTTEEVVSWVEGTTQPAMNLLLRIAELIEANTVKAARTATVVRSRRDETQ